VADALRIAAAEAPVGAGIAVFDLDGTLSRGDTFLPFLLGYLARHPTRWMALPYLAAAVARYYAGAIDNSRLKTAFLTAIVGGATADELRPWVAEFVPRLVRSGLRRDALAALASHRAAGRTTVLATASPTLYVAPLAAELGFDVVIASDLECDDAGRFTGRLAAGNCHGAEKAARFSAWRARSSASGQLWVYTDHHADLPLLELADRRFAVAPTRRLRDAAGPRGIGLLRWN
jgi:HAD superfamily hydrolase (TIGR01490 family)